MGVGTFMGVGTLMGVEFVVHGGRDVLCGSGDVVCSGLGTSRGGGEALRGIEESLHGCLEPSCGIGVAFCATDNALHKNTKNPLGIAVVVHAIGDDANLGGTNPLPLQGTPLPCGVLLPCTALRKLDGSFSLSLKSKLKCLVTINGAKYVVVSEHTKEDCPIGDVLQIPFICKSSKIDSYSTHL
jgi:hypothetical protein